MEKTDRQTVMELRQGKPIREIIQKALDKYQGKRHRITRVALEMDISITTLYKWCDALGIDTSRPETRIPEGARSGTER